MEKTPKYWFIIIFFTLFTQMTIISSLSSGKTADDGHLLDQCIGRCTYEQMSEIIDVITTSKSEKELVVRLCSDETNQIALAKARGNLINLTTKLKDTSDVQFKDLKVFFYSKCSVNVKKQVVTQFLLNSSEKSLPKFDTVIDFNRIKYTPINNENFTSDLENLIQHIKERPNSYGTVFGYFYVKPSLEVKSKLRKVRKNLKTLSLVDRYTVDLVPIGYVDSSETEPINLNFLIVEILK